VFAVEEEEVESKVTEDLGKAWVGLPDIRAYDGLARFEFCLEFVGLFTWR
jgi:hypothetical protein